MINSIHLNPLRNGEFIQFLVEFLGIVLKQDPDNLKVRELYNALLKVANENEQLFKLSQGSVITREIEAADLRRDNAITGIGKVAEGYTYHADSALRKHALVITTHLNLFGNVAKDNYLSETTSIRNIIADWDERPELQAAIAALGLDDWKAELLAANTDSTAKYTARNEELATATADNLKAKRAEASAAYYKLRDRINSHLDISEGAEPWAKTISLINQTIDNFNKLLARRGPGSDGGDAGTGSAPTPPETPPAG